MIFYRISYRKDCRLQLTWERHKERAHALSAEIRMANHLENGQVWVDQIEVPTLQKAALLTWLRENVAVGS